MLLIKVTTVAAGVAGGYSIKNGRSDCAAFNFVGGALVTAQVRVK